LINNKEVNIENIGEYFFGIAFKKDMLKKNFKINLKYFEHGEWLYIPLNMKELLEAEKMEERLKKEIIEIIKDEFLKNAA
jgi:uncharacterized protein YajQ (UPF0234 family)